MPLRVRLALMYVVLLAAALAVFGLAVYLIAADRIYADLDENLAVRADEVAAAFEPVSAPISRATLDPKLAALDEEAADGAIFQIRDVQGNILYVSSQPGSRSLPAPREATYTERTLVTGEIEGRRLRVLYRPIGRDGQGLGGVEVAEPLDHADDSVSRIRDFLTGGGLAILFVAGVSSYAFARRALAPIRGVSRLASDIERTADFSRRLHEPRAAGEMKELITTFNLMIGRVERTFQAQRAFLADSSHELRRPLAVLRMNIDILNDPALPPDQREVCLQEIRAEAETLTRLLADLLLLSREGGQAFDRAFVDYSSLCNEAMARLRTQDERHDLRSSVAAGVGVMGDKERLAQMVWNLLDNATRYTPDGGRIELRLRRLDGLVRLEVEDTGIGISKDELPLIFERFYRAPRARATGAEGSGLGLSIVKHVAEAHGGALAVSSQPDHGTVITVDMPAPV